MALQCDPPYLGDIGDSDPEPVTDPDRQYERQVEAKLSEENNADS